MKKAFTLAEVLITLALIGVVASMTVPGLIKSNQEAHLKIAFKRFYADFSQATKKLVMQEGGTLKGVFTSHTVNTTKLAEQMQTTKICLNSINTPGNCWHKDHEWFNILKNQSFESAGILGFVLTNGMYVTSWLFSEDCTALPLKACASFRVDVNGPKPPNTQGLDIFYIYMTENTAKPAGSSGDNYEEVCHKPTGKGTGCAAYVLTNRNY